MDTIKFNKNNVKMIAHRGLSGLEAENTASAFVAAGNHSYHGIETDVHRTGDGGFVVIHDGDLIRVADSEMTVEDKPISEIQSITLRDKDGSFGRADLVVPTLENYISICKKYEKHAVPELKSEFTDEEIEAILKIVERYGHLDSTTFISFNYDNLLKIRKIRPNQSVQFLFWEYTDGLLDRLVRDKIDVDINQKALTRELLDKFHAAGIAVNVWVVDDPERAAELAEWGIDMITSNILE